MVKGVWLIVSADAFFIKKMRLICERHGIKAICKGEALSDTPILGCIHDLDTEQTAPIPPKTTVLRFSRRSDMDAYPIPTPIDLVERLILGDSCGIDLDPKERTVAIGSRRISLTEMEYALLDRLLAAEGKVVTQEELLRDVWHGEAGAGTVTVYIHYLRQKLETGGERILRIKRGRGYYIDEKYAKGAIPC